MIESEKKKNVQLVLKVNITPHFSRRIFTLESIKEVCQDSSQRGKNKKGKKKFQILSRRRKIGGVARVKTVRESPLGGIHHQRVDLKLTGIKSIEPLLCLRRFRRTGGSAGKGKERNRGACYLFNNQNRRRHDAPLPPREPSNLPESRASC